MSKAIPLTHPVCLHSMDRDKFTIVGFGSGGVESCSAVTVTAYPVTVQN
jgi:hypothetical protein